MFEFNKLGEVMRAIMLLLGSVFILVGCSSTSKNQPETSNTVKNASFKTPEKNIKNNRNPRKNTKIQKKTDAADKNDTATSENQNKSRIVRSPKKTLPIRPTRDFSSRKNLKPLPSITDTKQNNTPRSSFPPKPNNINRPAALPGILFDPRTGKRYQNIIYSPENGSKLLQLNDMTGIKGKDAKTFCPQTGSYYKTGHFSPTHGVALKGVKLK